MFVHFVKIADPFSTSCLCDFNHGLLLNIFEYHLTSLNVSEKMSKHIGACSENCNKLFKAACIVMFDVHN